MDSNSKKNSSKNPFLLIVSILVLLTMVIGLGLYLYSNQKPKLIKVPAEGPLSISCGSEVGNTLYGLSVIHTFTGPNAENDCLACKNNTNCYTSLVGDPRTVCPNTADNNSCIQVGSPCKIEKEGGQCNFTTSAPTCSVVQLDCLDHPLPNLGSVLNGSGANIVNCGGCNPLPSVTPIPTIPISSPTPTLSPTPSPTPTTPINSPTPTPTGTITPSNTPTITPTATPGPSATPIPVGCGTKGCDNASNPCRSGLTCVQGKDGANYCTLPEFATSCHDNPSSTTCCSATAATNTPIPIAKSLPSAGGLSKPMFLIPIGIVVIGLFL